MKKCNKKMDNNLRRGAWAIYMTGIFASSILGATCEVNNLQIRRIRHNDNFHIAEYGLHAFIGFYIGGLTGFIWPITVTAIGLEKLLYSKKQK